MKILGIDPGMAIVGYGMIGVEKNNIELLTSGSIQTDKKLDDSKRLLEIYNDLSQIIEKYQPDCASVEQLFFFKCRCAFAWCLLSADKNVNPNTIFCFIGKKKQKTAWIMNAL